ncbi:MAG: ester cyclase [Nitrososphaera sp.]|nr:ester cyclase [Candidatus Nitrososphaera gargensis]
MSSLEEIEKQNIRIARRVFEAFNTGDVSKVSEFIGPEYFNHESQADPRRGKLRGPDEVIDTIKNLRGAFADLYYEEKETVASRDKAVSIMQVSGKHVGNFFGIAPTGRSFSYQAVHIHRIANGKVVEHRSIRDDLRFMMQLGLVGPGSPQYAPLFEVWKGAIR